MHRANPETVVIKYADSSTLRVPYIDSASLEAFLELEEDDVVFWTFKTYKGEHSAEESLP